jgi:integrase
MDRQASSHQAVSRTEKGVRYLTPLQANTLLQELPVHLADMVKFSLATGLRRANVTKLEWSQVDIARRVAWIHGDPGKGGKTDSCDAERYGH